MADSLGPELTPFLDDVVRIIGAQTTAVAGVSWKPTEHAGIVGFDLIDRALPTLVPPEEALHLAARVSRRGDGVPQLSLQMSNRLDFVSCWTWVWVVLLGGDIGGPSASFTCGSRLVTEELGSPMLPSRAGITAGLTPVAGRFAW